MFFVGKQSEIFTSLFYALVLAKFSIIPTSFFGLQFYYLVKDIYLRVYVWVGTYWFVC